MAKIIKIEELGNVVKELKDSGKSIVTANGCFDLLHFGHMEFLKEAKQQGDVLMVAVNHDEYLRKHKGPSRPIIPEQQRMASLAALECVDYVFSFDTPNPIPFLEIIKPDVHVNGAEYGENCLEAEPVKKHGGRLHLIKKVDGWSTTELVQRIKRA